MKVIVVLVGALLSCLFGCKERHESTPPGGSSSAAVASAAGFRPRSVRFQALPIRSGDTWTAERNSEMKVSVEFWKESDFAGRSEIRRREVYKQEIEVLSPLGAFAGKVRVKYTRYDHEDERPDQPSA